MTFFILKRKGKPSGYISQEAALWIHDMAL